MATNISGINPTGTPSSLDVFNASNDAISFKEQLPDLAQKLKDALTTKFNESPLFGQRQTATQNFLNQPTQTRADISNMQRTSGVPLSPTQQQSIEGARRSAAYVPLAANTLQLSSAFGGLEDMVKSGTDAFTAASNAQGERANLLNTLRKDAVEQMFKQKQLDLDYAKLNKGTGSSGLSLSNLLSIANYKKPTAQQTKDAISAQSGLNAIDTMYEILDKNPNVLGQKKIPLARFFNEDIQRFNAAAKEAYDVIQRTRTGAALNIGEQQFYKTYTPQFGDTQKTINDKFLRLGEIYNKVVAEGTEMDLGSLLQMSGINVPGLSSDWEVVSE